VQLHVDLKVKHKKIKSAPPPKSTATGVAPAMDISSLVPTHTHAVDPSVASALLLERSRLDARLVSQSQALMATQAENKALRQSKAYGESSVSKEREELRMMKEEIQKEKEKLEREKMDLKALKEAEAEKLAEAELMPKPMPMPIPLPPTQMQMQMQMPPMAGAEPYLLDMRIPQQQQQQLQPPPHPPLTSPPPPPHPPHKHPPPH